MTSKYDPAYLKRWMDIHRHRVYAPPCQDKMPLNLLTKSDLTSLKSLAKVELQRKDEHNAG